jgi:lipoprotein-anchoring transpeptidase ErfK/SrfK
MSPSVWRYRLGFLGSWALCAVAAGVTGVSALAERENLRDAAKLARLSRIDAAIGVRFAGAVAELKAAVVEHGGRVEHLRSDVAEAKLDLDEPSDAAQTILVSTAENLLRVRRGGRTVLTAVVSTGKGTKLTIDGRTMIFDTPTGRFHIQSKEENPVWVPPDWHYVEEARKKKLDLIRARPGDVLDADTGQPVTAGGAELWGLAEGEPRPQRLLEVQKDSIVEVLPDGTRKDVEPKEFIRAGKTLVVPPLGFKQRRLEKTLGRYRLNLGDGYALHGTQAVGQLGRSVSHGCVRLSDADLEKLFAMSRVGDEVIIY